MGARSYLEEIRYRYTLAYRTHVRILKELEENGIRSLVIGSVWPSVDVTPKDLGTEEIGGIDVIDYMTKLISRPKLVKTVFVT